MTTIAQSNSPYKVSSGQTDSGDIVSSGGSMFVLSGGTALVTKVSAGGFLTVSSGGTDSGTSLGGSETVLGYESAVTVLKGGIFTISSGGFAGITAVASGGLEQVYAAGTALDVTVSKGGALELIGPNPHVTGTAHFFSGAILEFGSGFSSATGVAGGLILEVLSRGFEGPGTVSSGGLLEVLSGGSAQNISIGSGGKLIVSGGSDGFSTVLSGGTETLLAGGREATETISGGGKLIVSAGGFDDNIKIDSGAVQIVSSGGTGEQAYVSSGGTALVLAGGTDMFATVSAGGLEFISSGGIAINAGISSGGTELALHGAIFSAVVSSGGTILVSAGGTTSDGFIEGKVVGVGASMTSWTIESAGTEIVSSGSKDTGTVVSSGGTLIVLSGATATSDTVKSSGEVIVSSGGTAIGLDANAGSIVTVAHGGTVSFASGTEASPASFVNSGTANVPDGGQLALSGTFINAGALNFSGGGAQLFVSNVTLSGGGTILLVGDGQNSIDAVNAGDTLTNVDNTIAGAGSLGDNGLAFVNSGTVNANSTSAALLVTLAANSVTNDGTFEATASGGLAIENNVVNSATMEALGTHARVVLEGGYTISNTAAAVVAALGSNATVQLLDGGISGGLLKTSGSGAVIEATSDNTVNALSGVTIESGSVVEIADGAVLKLAGMIVNSGTVSVGAALSPTYLYLQGAVSLTGGGHVTLSSSGSGAIQPFGPSTTLTNVDNAITGAGLIGEHDTELTLINSGTIDGNDANPLTIDTFTNSIMNSGTLEGTASGGIVIGSDVANSGKIAALGTNAKAVLSGTNVTDTGGGPSIVASGSGAQVVIGGSVISGGELVTSGTSAAIETGMGPLTNALSGVTIGSGSLVKIADDTELTLAGTIANSGTLSAAATSDSAQLFISGTVMLSGGGKVLFSSNSIENDIEGLAAGAVLSNVDNTIAGDGTIGAGNDDLTLVNSGVVDANLKGANGALTIATGTPVDVNAGTLEATSSGTLYFQDSVIGNMGSGAIVASGGQVVLEGSTISGGTLRTSGTGVVSAANFNADDVLSGVTNSGLLVVGNDANLELAGAFFVNDGKVLISTANGAELQIDNDLTISGGGTIAMTPVGTSVDAIDAAMAGVTLTNDNIISGAGNIGENRLILKNYGTIVGTSSNGLLISGAGTDVNAGTLESTAQNNVEGNGGLVIETDLANSGTVEAKATNAVVHISGAKVSNTASALLLASGAGAQVLLDDAVVSGGTVGTIGANAAIVVPVLTSATISGATIAANSLLETQLDGELLFYGDTFGSGAHVNVSSDGTAAFIGGTIGSGAVIETGFGGTAAFFGVVANSGTIIASAGPSLVEVALGGQISGGVTEIVNGTAKLAGGETVKFQAGGGGVLQLSDEAGQTQNYSGTISGFGQNTLQEIELVNVMSAVGAISVTYSAAPSNTSGVLMVSSGGVVVADIDLIGHYATANFKIGATLNNQVIITDPPIAGGTHAANLGLFGQQIAASLVRDGGFAVGTPAQTTDTAGEQQPLLPASHS